MIEADLGVSSRGSGGSPIGFGGVGRLEAEAPGSDGLTRLSANTAVRIADRLAVLYASGWFCERSVHWHMGSGRCHCFRAPERTWMFALVVCLSASPTSGKGGRADPTTLLRVLCKNRQSRYTFKIARFVRRRRVPTCLPRTRLSRQIVTAPCRIRWPGTSSVGAWLERWRVCGSRRVPS